MRCKVIVAFFVFVTCISVSAKDPLYSISSIPPALLENTHTVYRENKAELEIYSEKSAKASITEVRSILNKNGEMNIDFTQFYSPMIKISNLRGKVYDATGKRVKSFGPDDVQDYSAISGFSLYEDSRVQHIDPKYLNYPFTVEYSYDLDFKQTLFLPQWSHSDENTSYEKSSFTVTAPTAYSFRFKEYNLPSKVVKTTASGKDIYSWSLVNLVSRRNEPMSSSSEISYPKVELVPNKFEVLDSKGSTETWKDLGLWASNLNDKKDVLPEATVLKMKEITANCKTDHERVKVIYEYMQQKTRYVNISIGIGGWQPIDATTVDKTSYGDCKALSNYTKALLKSVGINSYYALVQAGARSKSVDTTFPSSQFNHAIVLVPIDKDSIWLECTSQRLPFGFNSDFTDDRDVLIIDGENSKLVHTRIYSAAENCIKRNVYVNFVDDIAGNAIIKTTYTGLQYDDMTQLIYAVDAEKKKMITREIEIPSFSLLNYNITESRSKTPSILKSTEIDFSNYLKKMGDVALLPLNFMNKMTSIPDKVRNRKTPMSIRRAYMENDTVVYQLPRYFVISEVPQNMTINSKFGTYTRTVNQQKLLVTYTRHFELYKGEFTASEYAEFREFLESISAADEAVVSLTKRT